MIYFDHNASTPLHPSVVDAMQQSLQDYGNPSGPYAIARAAKESLEADRATIAKTIGSRPDQLFFTSGATEANNWVLHQAFIRKQKGDPRQKVLISSIEHASIRNTAQHLRELGVDTQEIRVDRFGFLDQDHLAELLDEETFLVSVVLGNNEIGTVQDLATITSLAQSKGAMVHTDAAQCIGKMPLDMGALNVDFASFSAHKSQGPKGIGALYARDESKLKPLMVGGGQERRLRPGTPAQNLIAGFRATATLNPDIATLKEKRDQLLRTLLNAHPDLRVQNPESNALPNTLNLALPGIKGEAIMMNSDLAGLAISTGSACSTGSIEPSHVLLACGYSQDEALESIRISIGHNSSDADITQGATLLTDIFRRLKEKQKK